MYILNFFIPRKRYMSLRHLVVMCACIAVIIMFVNHVVVMDSDAYTAKRSTDMSFPGAPGLPNVTLKTAPAKKTEGKRGGFWAWFAGSKRKKSGTHHRPIDIWEPVKDPHDFKYLHNPKYMCNDLAANSSDILLVIFVNSAPKNVQKREYIRKTFGDAGAWPSHGSTSVMRMVFLVAGVDEPEVQDQIHFESVLYNDIVQENFKDDYFNLTRKTIMGMKWVTKFCRRAKYTMKIDDDILLNVPRVLDIIALAPEKNFTMGTVHWAKPVRTTKGYIGKYYTPKKIFAGKQYPPYLNGHAYMMSTDVVEKVYHLSQVIDLFPWSDVFVGMCMDKLGLKLRHSQLFVSYGFKFKNKTALEVKENSEDIIREHVTIYHQKEETMNQIWEIWTRQR